MRTPKEQFLAHPDEVRKHNDQVDSPEWHQLITLAQMQYMSLLEASVNPQLMIVNEAKRQGVVEFVRLLAKFGKPDIKPVRKIEGILGDPDRPAFKEY